MTKPVAPARGYEPPTPSPASLRASRAAAVKLALAHARVLDTCSGPILPDVVNACTSPSSTGTDTYTFSLTSTADLLLLRIQDSNGNELGFTLTAPGGGSVSCQLAFGQLPQCPTSQSGTYTLAVSNDAKAYTLSFVPLLSDKTCSVANPSFASPALTGSIAAGAAGACFTLAMTAGDVLHANIASNPFQDLLVTVYDSTGTLICFDEAGDCPLTGTGPYWVFVNTQQGEASTYWLEFNDVTQPQGCLAAPQLTYGTAPDVSSTVRCRTLTVSTAGQYQVFAVSPENGRGGLAGTLYHPDGSVACTNSGPTCDLAVGTYNFVADPYPEYTAHVGVVFIAANESRGCTATGDTDFASGPATGTFSEIGEEICLTLPTAASKTDYLFDQPTADGSAPQLEVVDATGAQVCQNGGFVETICTLTGTAPFRVILSGQVANGGYGVLTQRTDSTAGCRVWPRSGFGGSWGATATLTASADVACLSIPAKEHSTGEMIDYSNIANVVDAAIYVNDPTGTNVCIGNSTAVCSYKPTVTYTALLILAHGQRDTFHLVRRDVSSTASCRKPASTVPGVPSATLLLNSDLDAQCFRVTAKATDDLAFDVRASAPGTAGAVLEVMNNSGTILCRQFGVNCTVTGATSYQAIVIADNYQGIGITAHVDTWIVGTKTGWAPQCEAHKVSASTGWAPVRVSLSQAAPVYCQVVAVQPNQRFWLYSTLNVGFGGGPIVTGYSKADWTSDIGLCGSAGSVGVGCQTQPTDKAGDDVLLIYPGQQALPFSGLFQGVCNMTCSVTVPPALVTSVKPNAGPADSINTIVVGGTHLNLGTQIELSQNGVAVDRLITPVSLNSRATSMTMQVGTSGVAPGLYDVAMDNVGYTTGVPSPGYLPGAYRVTAAPPKPPSGTFVPVGPVRVANTRTGLGVPKAPIAAHGVVRLKVLGVAGVPSTGVAAVVVSITARDPAQAGSLTVYPDRTTRPGVTDLSFAAGQTITDQVVAPVRNGRIDIYNGSGGRLDLAADLSGYYATTGPHSLLSLIGPSRILEARTGAQRLVSVPVEGVAGVPKSGVSAVEVNLTVRSPAKPGYLAAFPDGRPRPGVSQLSFGAGQTISGLASVPVLNGKIDLYNGSAGPVDVTADVVGYFSAAGGRFRVAGPVRVLDTRTGFGGAGDALLPRGAAELGIGNLPDLPITVTAAVLSVTVIGGRAGGSLTVFPDGQALPAVPTISFGARTTVTDQVIVPVTGPSIDFYNNSGGDVQVLADVQGYYYTP